MINDRLKGVASRLKHMRVTEHCLSLEEAAKKLGINKSSLNRYEMGKQIPDAKFLFICESAYGRSAEWILSGQESDETSFSIKEKQYLILIEYVAIILARTLHEKGVVLKWQYYGKVLKMLLCLSLEFTHEGTLLPSSDDSESFFDELSNKLKPQIDDLIIFVSEKIFE